MAHLHSVVDTDKHFRIIPQTRKIVNASGKKKLMRLDHKSEQFSFELPRFIDGHDMSLCNVLEVHYNNISEDGTEQKPNMDELTDIHISPDNEDVVIFSWLITENCTQLAGILSFFFRFSCVNDDGTVEYNWHTDSYDEITVGDVQYNSPVVIEFYADIIHTWKQTIVKAAVDEVTPIKNAAENAQQKAEEAQDGAEKSATAAANSEKNASQHEQNAYNYAVDAQNAAQNAANSEANAKGSEDNAKTSEVNAKASETAAGTSAGNAKTSENNAKQSEQNAATHEKSAKTAQEAAETAEQNAETSETNAKASEEAAGEFAKRAEAASQNAAWVEAEIDDNGHLIVHQSDNFLGAAFSINENGHLEVAYT